jgi:hypothetical protein
MKKTTTLLFFIFLFSSLLAQYNYTSQWPSRIKMGVEGGVGRNTLFGNPTNEKMNVASLGFNGGLTFEYDINQPLHPDSTVKGSIHFGIKTGIYYERKGASNTPQSLVAAGFPAGNTTIRAHFEYITIPVLVKFMMGRANRVKLYQMLGPYVSVLANQTSIHQRPDTANVVVNNTSAYKKVDIGLSLGFGIEIPVKQKFYFNVELRQNIGLLNINQTALPANANVQTNSTTLLFGFSYRFNRTKPYKEK